jgi:hypothetical protein
MDSEMIELIELQIVKEKRKARPYPNVVVEPWETRVAVWERVLALREAIQTSDHDLDLSMNTTRTVLKERDALREELAKARDVSYECRAVGEDGAGCGFGSNTPGDCPNCNRPLTPQTWKERAMSAAAKIPHLMAENAALREELRQANEMIDKLGDR